MDFYHVSNPVNRESILKNGLVPKVGDSYRAHYENKGQLEPRVFVCSTNSYDSTYEDDRYKIVLSDEEIKWLELKKDPDVEDGYFTHKPIKSSCLELIHKGTSKSTF